MIDLDVRLLASYMSLLYLFGAARQDATPEQMDGLRLLVDVMRDMEVPREALVVYIFQDVMGWEWAPGEKWLDAIEAINR